MLQSPQPCNARITVEFRRGPVPSPPPEVPDPRRLTTVPSSLKQNGKNAEEEEKDTAGSLPVHRTSEPNAVRKTEAHLWGCFAWLWIWAVRSYAVLWHE